MANKGERDAEAQGSHRLAPWRIALKSFTSQVQSVEGHTVIVTNQPFTVVPHTAGYWHPRGNTA